MRTRLADAAELESLDESANQSGIWGQEAVQTAKTLRITARRIVEATSAKDPTALPILMMTLEMMRVKVESIMSGLAAGAQRRK